MRQFCYSLALGAIMVALDGTPTSAAPPSRVRPATFTAPFAHGTDPVHHTSPGQYQAQSVQQPMQQGQYGPQPFRWGWFGADYYAPAPIMHRDYNRGWTEWQYRR